MIILGIETSCDETAICIIETDDNSPSSKIKILGNQLYSQIALHAQYGGVFPMMAKREHIKNLTPLLEQCLIESSFLKSNIKNQISKINEEKKEKINEILVREQGLFEPFIQLVEKIDSTSWNKKIDVIAVTNGPGLEPALWVGVSFAKAISEIWDIPIIPTNHMEGHIVVAQLQQYNESKVESHKVIKLNLETKSYQLKTINYPAVALLISGGHTQLVLIKESLKYEIIGNTKDDAIGEAYDKVARILGLPYPGGPEISRLADIARNNADLTQINAEKSILNNSTHGLPELKFKLPRPMIHSGDLNFSFSGIKTAVLYLVKDIFQRQSASSPHLSATVQAEIAKEFEDAVVEVIVKKTKEAVEQYGAQTIIIGGGVSANKKIRADFTKLAENLSVEFLVPEVSASTDNAFMIALAGYMNIKSGKLSQKDFKAFGNLSLQ